MKNSEIQGLSVRIILNGEHVAREFPHPDIPDMPKTATRYVLVHGGATFAIETDFKANFKHKSRHIRQKIFIDDDLVHTCLVTSEELHDGKIMSVAASRIENTRGNFMFSKLNFVEGESHNVNDKQMDKIKSIGTISVQLFREKAKEIEKKKKKNGPLPLDIPESKLKGHGIDHRVQYLAKNKKGTSEGQPPRKFTPIDKDSDPCAKFIFLYRGRKALEALRILAINFDATKGDRLERIARAEAVRRAAMKRKRREESTYDGEDDGDIDDDDLLGDSDCELVGSRKKKITLADISQDDQRRNESDVVVEDWGNGDEGAAWHLARAKKRKLDAQGAHRNRRGNRQRRQSSARSSPGVEDHGIFKSQAYAVDSDEDDDDDEAIFVGQNMNLTAPSLHGYQCARVDSDDANEDAAENTQAGNTNETQDENLGPSLRSSVEAGLPGGRNGEEELYMSGDEESQQDEVEAMSDPV